MKKPLEDSYWNTIENRKYLLTTTELPGLQKMLLKEKWQVASLHCPYFQLSDETFKTACRLYGGGVHFKYKKPQISK